MCKILSTACLTSDLNQHAAFSIPNPVCEEIVMKIIKSFNMKHCSLDPWPAFLSVIMFPPVTEGEFAGFPSVEKAIITPLIKESLLIDKLSKIPVCTNDAF